MEEHICTLESLENTDLVCCWATVGEHVLNVLDACDCDQFYFGRSGRPDRRMLDHFVEKGLDNMAVVYRGTDERTMYYMEPTLIDVLWNEKGRLNKKVASCGNWPDDDKPNFFYIAFRSSARKRSKRSRPFSASRHYPILCRMGFCRPPVLIHMDLSKDDAEKARVKARYW